MVSFVTLLSVLLAVRSTIALYPTTGAQGGVYPRLEIRDLAANYPQQYSLFIQAVQALQNNGTTDFGSYYQIAGIHGLPSTDWDGVSGNGGGTGYCTHSMNIFPTWHRPYLALYEQQLNSFAKKIALQYTTNQAQWINAAIQLRLPYYDWIIAPAAGKSAFPDELLTTNVTIQTPSGQQTVTNPIFAYKFPQTVPGFGSPYNTWNYTLRWPSSTNANATSQNDQVRSTIEQNRNSQRSGVYQMFLQCSDFALLSSQSQSRPSGCPTSLEDFHGSYHVYIGGTSAPYGHMSIVPYAAFDPIFMLHHAQVDRLFALWQVLWPSSYVKFQTAGSSTKTISKGSLQGPDSALTPFRKSSSQFWTSTTSRDTKAFGYTYAEVISANGNAILMQNQINALYGPSATKTAGTSPVRQVKRALPNISSDLLSIGSGSGIINEYSANIVTSKFGLGGSYSILVFFNNPTSSDPSTWLYDPNLIGSYGVFASMDTTNNDLISSASVPLTTALAERIQAGGPLSSLLPIVVVPFLKANLQWRIVKGGQEIDPKNVPGLKITVVSSLRVAFDQSKLAGFPKWDTFQELPGITAGKPGGSGF